MKESALYVHVPFCDHKCVYCDFYSIITTYNVEPFLDHLKKEIEFYSYLFKEDHRFTSVFFGGGTPSLLCPENLNDIILHLKKYFIVSDDAEITLETNPGTVTNEKLKNFLESGVNRISIGIQSFYDDDLRFLTRIHNKKTAVDTVLNASYAGYNNISIDLIFNLPGQSKQKWLHNLNEAVNLPVNHISAYSLILEKGTILNKLVLDGIVKMQDNDYDADLYETTIDFLTSKGFNQYEVSNFAKDGYECLHNKAYWRHRDYLGLGPSAHSFMNGKRWWNFSSVKRYISEIDKNGNAEAGSEMPRQNELLEEYIMLGLRSTGINLNEVETRFGKDWYLNNSAFLDNLEKNGFISRSGEQLRLTSRGYAVCDEIIAKFK